MQKHTSRSACVALYVWIGYVQEVSSAVQQLLSCVARSSQSSQAVAQQAIVGLTRMAGQHTLLPHYTVLHLALQHTGSITSVLFCPVFTKKAPLTITSRLCHTLHEVFKCILIITPWDQNGLRHCSRMSLLDAHLIQ